MPAYMVVQYLRDTRCEMGFHRYAYNSNICGEVSVIEKTCLNCGEKTIDAPRPIRKFER